jgi:hypothetical protein
MADENLTDVQKIVCAIPSGYNGTRITVTHNLHDKDGNHLTPDTVIAQVMDPYPAGDDAPCMISTVRTPSSPEDGTYELEVRMADASSKVADQDITLQITSMYHHSIQSDDHTPGVTVQDGTPIEDCSGQEPE